MIAEKCFRYHPETPLKQWFGVTEEDFKKIVRIERGTKEQQKMLWDAFMGNPDSRIRLIRTVAESLPSFLIGWDKPIYIILGDPGDEYVNIYSGGMYVTMPYFTTGEQARLIVAAL